MLAIVFLTIILSLITALLMFAFASSQNVRTYRQERIRRYAADGAMSAAVQRLRVTPTLGTTSSTCLRFPITDTIAGGPSNTSITAGSVLLVTCDPVAGTPTVDVDGGQAPRDVIITVRCFYNPSTTNGPNKRLSCGDSGTAMVLGTARVRFEIDYGITPTSTVSASNCADPDCTVANNRAVVPKIVTWSTKAG